MRKIKFKDTRKQAQNGLWMFTVVSLLLVIMLIFFGLWNTNWDFNVLLPGYGIWTKSTYLDVDVWIHLRYLEGIKVTQDTVGASFDIGVLPTAIIVQLISFIIYANERTRRLLKKALDPLYILLLKLIGKFKSLQADMKFRSLVQDLDTVEKKDTWKLLAGLKLERHLQKERKKTIFERSAYPDIENDTKRENRSNWSKKTIKFVDKEQRLREEVTDTWIDAHIRHINFRYPRITTIMILTGNTSVKIPNMAIEDVKKIARQETIRRIISSLLSLVYIAVIGSIISITFKYDTWKAVKDVLVYSITIVFAFIWAISSSNTIHNSKELEIEDRLGYIQKYVGMEKIEEVKKDLLNDAFKKSELEKFKLEQELNDLKQKVKDIETV